MKKLTASLLASALLSLSSLVTAMPIDGNIGFTGSYQHNGTSDLSTATQIFNISATVAGNVDGTYAAEGVSAGNAASYSNFDFSTSGMINNLWSVGGFSFDLGTINIDFQGSNALVLSGVGTVKHNNYDNTVASWIFTANQAGSNLTFSSSNVPEPGIALLLGVGLAGIAFTRKLRKNI